MKLSKEEALAELKRRGIDHGYNTNKTSGTEAFGRGALESASLGFAPKIVGALGGAVLPYIRPDLYGDKPYKELYKEFRDTARSQQHQAAEEHPFINTAGNIIGGAALPFPTNTVKGAAKLGGLYGAAQGVGSNDSGEVGNLGLPDLVTGLWGASTGAAGGAAGQYILNKFFPGKVAPQPEVLERLDMSKEFQVPLTEGEATANSQKLLREEAALRGELGPENQFNLKNLKDVQVDSFGNAARKVATDIAGGEEFVSKGAAASDVVNKIQQEALGSRAAYSKLYQEATKDITVLDTNDLKQFPKLAIADFENSALTADNVPRTFNELKSLSKILEHEAINLNSLEAWKQGLNRSIREVPRGGQEEFALKQLSQKFSGYLDGKIEKALIEGDSNALSKLKNASKLTAQWYERYGAKNPSEFGKRFIEDIVDNARFSREPYTDEMLVNKILGTSELGFKPESAAIVGEIKRHVGKEDFQKIKLEAASRIIGPLLKENPNIGTYKNNLKRLVEGNPTLLNELFTKEEVQQLEKIGKIGEAIFSRKKSLSNPSGTAAVLIDFISRKSGFGFAKDVMKGAFNKIIDLNQDSVRKAALAGESTPKQMGGAAKAFSLGLPSTVISKLVDRANQKSQTPRSEQSFPTKENSRNNNYDISKEEARRMLESRGIDWRADIKIDKPQQNEVQQPETIGNFTENNSSLLDKIKYIESGNDPNARSKTSSASGLYQFTDETWKDLSRRHGIKANKNNPVAQRMMAEVLLNENRSTLSKKIGRKPTDGELYMAHFLGAGGASKLINSYGSNQLAARVFPKAAKANRSIFFAKGRPRTVEEVYQVLDRKVGPTRTHKV